MTRRQWLWLLWVGLGLACAWPARWPAAAPSTTTPTPTTAPRTTPTPDLVEALDYDIEYWNLLIPGLYHLYGSVLDEFILARITNPSEQPVRLVLEAQVEGFTDWATATVRLSPGATATVPLHPVLHPQAIDALTQLQPANLHIRVRMVAPREAVVDDFTDRVMIYARRDFPWNLHEVLDTLDEHTNNMLLAAWITPNDPAIEGWIRTAAEYHPDRVMTSGYHDRVDLRLAALWDALNDAYDITYVSTSFNLGDAMFDGLRFQRIRFPSEVLHQRSANCIETTLLWASVAEALQWHPYVVLTPDHAFVLIDADPEGETAYALETTLIGRGDLADALDLGWDEWEEVRAHLLQDDEGYDVVDVWAAREAGILPMPWP